MTSVANIKKQIFHLYDYVLNWFYYHWFRNADTIPLEVMRIGIGFLLFFNYAMIPLDDLYAFYGSEGLLNREFVTETQSPYFISVFAYFDSAWPLTVFHTVFLILSLCLCIGLKTIWVKWPVLVMHINYFNANELLFYGVDTVAIALLFVLCLAPIGSAWSVDRLMELRRHRVNCKGQVLPAQRKSRIGFACQRLLQLQMAVIFFNSGWVKLNSESWQSGMAPWIAFNNVEVAFIPLDLFANFPWLISFTAYFTIALEVGYAVFIWPRFSRLYVLSAAILLHLGIAIVMGMVYFASLMIVGHLAFMRRQWYTSIFNMAKDAKIDD